MLQGFFPRITLPTRIQPPAISLIDNILANNINEAANSMSGLLINDLSDHKMIFTRHKNNTYIGKIKKFVEIEKRDDTSMSNFAEELISLNIYDKLDKNIANDPNQNYEIFAEAINYAREKHLPKKKVKYKKSIHKKSKWITSGILKSINTKDKLYKILIQTNTTTIMDLYHRLKEEFKQYRAKPRKSIREAKRQYFISIFNRHKVM